MDVWSPNLEIRRSNDYETEKFVKPQAIGGRNGLPLAGKAEGEEIVSSLFERQSDCINQSYLM